MREHGFRPRWYESNAGRTRVVLLAVIHGGARWQPTRRNVAELVGAVLNVRADRVKILPGVDGPGTILIVVPRRTSPAKMAIVATELERLMPLEIAFRLERMW
jgi:hypothetical protein